MLDRELTLFVFNRNYLRLLAADLDEASMNVAPFEGGNPPVWILGHLAVSIDSAGRFFGLERACPRDWQVKFSPGSKPAELKPPLPSKAELVEAIENGCRRVIDSAPKATADFLSQPHAVEILKPTVLKTNGDVLAHLMNNHFAFHLAQLSACRRKSGKPPVI